MTGFNPHEQVSIKASELFQWLNDNGMENGTYATVQSMNVLNVNETGWGINTYSSMTEVRYVQQIAVSKISSGEIKPALKIGITASRQNDTLYGSVGIYALDNGNKFVEWKRGKDPDSLKYAEVGIVINAMNSVISEKTWYEFDKNGNRVSSSSVNTSTHPMEIITLGEENTELDQLKRKFVDNMDAIMAGVEETDAELRGDNKFGYLPKGDNIHGPMIAFSIYKVDNVKSIHFIVDNPGSEKVVNGFRAWYSVERDGDENVLYACICSVGEKEYSEDNKLDGLSLDELSDADIRSIYDDLTVMENVDAWVAMNGNDFLADGPDSKEE